MRGNGNARLVVALGTVLGSFALGSPALGGTVLGSTALGLNSI